MSVIQSIGDIFQIGIGILRTVIADTKAIMVQTGDAATNTVEADYVEWWQHVGFISRPPKAEAGKRSAEAVAIRQHGNDVIIASRDLRGLELAGALQEGETCVYAPGTDGTAQGRILLKADGSVAIYTLEGNAAGGASCTIQVRPSGEIHLASPLGGISITSDKLTLLSAAGSGVECSASGVSIVGNTNIINGSVVLGDATATGVATQASLTSLMGQLALLCTALSTFLNFPTIGALSGGTAQPAALAAATLGATAALPTNYSLMTKAS